MAIDPIKPSNMNLLGDNTFHFAIRELPAVSLFAQTVDIPGVNIGRAIVPTSNVDYNQPGDKVEFDDLSIQFIVDEDLANYREVWNWIMYLGYPESTEQFRMLADGETQYTEKSDIYMTTTTNKFNPNWHLKFVDAFPVMLSGISFINNNITLMPLVATVTFDYSYYKFQKV